VDVCASIEFYLRGPRDIQRGFRYFEFQRPRRVSFVSHLGRNGSKMAPYRKPVTYCSGLVWSWLLRLDSNQQPSG
jgi:hypothetical protein